MKKTFFVALLTLPIVLVGCGEAPAGNDPATSNPSSNSSSMTSVSSLIYSDNSTPTSSDSSFSSSLPVTTTSMSSASSSQTSSSQSVASGEEHRHQWGEPIYKWSSDNSYCVAERVCVDDVSHKESERANSTYIVVTEPKCETDGLGRYSVSFQNAAFAAQTKEVTIDATGHDWGEAEYTWASSHSYCTAMRTCKNDPTHIEREVKFSERTIVDEATYEKAGLKRYTATFDNPAFETQVYEETLPIVPMVKYVKFSTYCRASADSQNIYGDIEIASEYEGLPVTFVDDFFGCHDITSITMPDSIEKINGNAFQACKSLAQVNFGAGIEEIGYYAFSQTAITEITVPDSVTYLGMETFSSCGNLVSAHIGKNVDSMDGIFRSCGSIADITLPYIGESKTSNQFLCYLFGYSYYWSNGSVPESLKKITLLDSCENIGDNALNGCNHIASIELPSTVTSLGSKCFYDCTSLTEIKFGGTKADWGRITLGEQWKQNVPATSVMCSDGAVAI